MSAPQIYLAEMHQRFTYLATWLPNTPIRLGDIGVLRRDRFEPVTRLSEVQDLPVNYTRGDRIDLQYSSMGCVETAFSAAGMGNGGVSNTTSEVKVKFSREDAVLFAATGCTAVQLEGVRDIGKVILKLFDEGTWQRDWVVITQVLEAESATIVISEQESAELVLTARGSLDGSLRSLANADATLQVKDARGIGLQILAEKGLNPLFRAHGVKRTKFGFGRNEFRQNAVREPRDRDFRFEAFVDEDRQ